MRITNAAGNKSSEERCSAIKGHTAARPNAATITMTRRAPWLRSISGPSSGETTANGAIVMRRYNRTVLLAASGLIEKNNDPAKEIVTSVSPAIMRT